MKWCKWPRPPFVIGLVTGFVLSWVTEVFPDTETVGMTIRSMFWPAVAVLPVVALAAGVVFKRGKLGVRGARPEEVGADAGSGGGPASYRDSGSDDSGPRERIAVTLPSLFTMAVIVAGIWGLYVAATFPSSDKAFPLLNQLCSRRSGRSSTVLRPSTEQTRGHHGHRDAERRADGRAEDGAAHGRHDGRLHALLHVIGLRYASILFPLGPTLLFLEGRTRWMGAAVGVALLGAFNLALSSIE